MMAIRNVRTKAKTLDVMIALSAAREINVLSTATLLRTGLLPVRLPDGAARRHWPEKNSWLLEYRMSSSIDVAKLGAPRTCRAGYRRLRRVSSCTGVVASALIRDTS